MKYAWVFIALAACGGGGSGADVDAGVADAGEDSGSGPQPDALDPGGDLDGDGVLNGVDDCVTVADPAQFDMDGDGLGWMCDPYEATSVPLSGEWSSIAVAIGGATIAATGQTNCSNGICSQAEILAGPSGMRTSTSTADAWLGDFVLRGYVGAENHVLWSLITGVIGDHAVATGTFTPVLQQAAFDHTGTGTARYQRDSLTVLQVPPRESPDAYRLVEPQVDGTVKTIATSGKDFASPRIVGHGDPTLVFGVSDDDGKSLRQFSSGEAQSEPVTVGAVVLDQLDSLVSLGALGFCAEKNGMQYIVETNNDQLRSYLGQATGDFGCLLQAGETTEHRFVLLENNDGGFYMLDGVKHALPGQHAGLASSKLPAVVSFQVPPADVNSGPTYTTYVIDATGEHLAAQGAADSTTQQGDTTHFLTYESGAAKIVRYRNGVVTKVALPGTDPNEGEVWKVFTTKEGAAIATTNVRAVVWPSQAASAAVVDFDHVELVVANDLTLFIASHNAATSQPALYWYSEVGGAPHYTALTPEVNQAEPFTMTIDTLPTVVPYATQSATADTVWFSYSKSNDYCRVVRPVPMGGTVMLLGNYDCGATIAGETSAGQQVIYYYFASQQHIDLSDGTTFTTAAVGNQLQPIYAAPGSSRVLGWYGVDNAGRFYCSASQPDRCWTPPGEVDSLSQEITHVPLGGSDPDAMHFIFVGHTADQFKITSFKSVGLGDRSQPLH